jgi:hypothetical protein
VGLEPKVECDNHFMNRYGMTLVRLERWEEKEKNEKIYCAFPRHEGI